VVCACDVYMLCVCVSVCTGVSYTGADPDIFKGQGMGTGGKKMGGGKYLLLPSITDTLHVFCQSPCNNQEEDCRNRGDTRGATGVSNQHWKNKMTAQTEKAYWGWPASETIIPWHFYRWRSSVRPA